MCSSWMLIVTVVCGFVTGVVLFSHKHHANGVKYLSKVAVCKLACKPAMSKQSLFIWVIFFFKFVSKSEQMKNPTREQAKGFLPFGTARCFPTLCCCCALFLAVVAPNFLNRWPWQVLGQLCSAVANCGSQLASQLARLFFLFFSPAFYFSALFFFFFWLLLNYMLRFSLLFIPSSLIHGSIFCDLLS